MTPRKLSSIVLLFTLILGVGTPVEAQDIGTLLTSSSGMPGGGPTRTSRPNLPPMLRKVSLDLRDVRLSTALDSIANQARLGLQYSGRVVPVERRVSIVGEGLTVGGALGQVLSGTDVEPVVTGAETILLVRRREQVGRITGVVVDATSGSPIQSAQVLLRGTRLGALSGADGSYIIAGVPPGTYVVEASSVGYAPARREGVQVTGAELRLDFSLEPTTIQLQELIVTGVVDPIAAAKIPFSVGRVARDQIPVPTGDATGLIAAKIPGITVLNAGTPGGEQYIQIRTPTTISKAGAPMYVVDGVILSDDTKPIDLDALDVESVEVVKGAAAASLYGSRAAAGVISITTNRGKGLAEGTTRVTFRSEYGLSQIGRTIPLNQSHWFVVNEDGEFVNAAGQVVRRTTQRAIAADRLSDKAYAGPIYDNFGEFFHPGEFWLNSASIAQNSGKTNFLASFNNHKQSGVLRTHGGYERNTLRLNVDHQLSDELGVSVTASHMRSRRQDISGSPFYDLLAFPPDVDLGARGEDGNYIPYPDSTISTDNPIWRQTSRDDYTERMQTLARGALRYQARPWLRLDADAGYDRSDMNAQTYTPRGTPTGPTGESTGSFRRDAQWGDALNASASASLMHQFFDRLTARMTLRGVMERQKSINMLASGRDLYVHGIPRPELGQARPTVGSQQFEIRSNGYFLQAGMDYEGKYIGDFLVRRDGSSLFGPDTRWNTYYRAAVAYRVSQEPWWPFEALDEFKLRASVGTAGGRPGFNDQFETYLVSYLSANRSTLGNRRLKPSHTREVELGADLVALGRLSLELTYARQVSTDQIVQVPQPAATGFKNRWENAGTIEGHTLEATLRADLYRSKDLQWSMNLVADRSRNEITEWGHPCFISGLTRHCPGIQRGDIYGYRYVRSAEELHTVHAGSRDQFQVNDDGFLVPVGAGNSWRDGVDKGLWNTNVTIDGVTYAWGLPITMKDAGMSADSLVRLGSMAPDVRLGYGNTVRWKDVSFYALVDWQVGGLVHNYTKQQLYRSLRAGDVDQAGKEEWAKKPIDYYVRLSSTGSTVVDHFVEPGGFVKLRELSVRYNMPQSTLGKFGFGRLGAERVSLALIGRNLFTRTKYSGFDPEVGSVFYRSDNFGYPNFRTITGNIEIVF